MMIDDAHNNFFLTKNILNKELNSTFEKYFLFYTAWVTAWGLPF